MIAWVKSLSLWAILGAISAAIFMVLNARRAGRIEAEIDHGESRIRELNQGTNADITAAKGIQEDIKRKKILADEVRKKSEKALERLGQDETMADIAERFNGRRVRERTPPIATVPGSRKKSGKRHLSS